MWSAIASRTKGGTWVVKKVAIIGAIDIMMPANELIVILLLLIRDLENHVASTAPCFFGSVKRNE